MVHRRSMVVMLTLFCCIVIDRGTSAAMPSRARRDALPDAQTALSHRIRSRQPDVLVLAAGDVFVARERVSARELYRGPDPAAAIQAAIDATGEDGGAIKVLPGRYPFSSSHVRLPADRTGWTRLEGYGAVLVLPAEQPTAFAWENTSPCTGSYPEAERCPTFRKLEIAGFTFDGAGQNAAPGGPVRGVVVGFGNAFTGMLNVNYEQLVLRDLRVRNVPTDWAAWNNGGLRNGPMRVGVQIQVAPDEEHAARALTMTDVAIDRVWVEGCGFGFLVNGAGRQDATGPSATRQDRISIRRSGHVAAQSIDAYGWYWMNSVLIGSTASVGTAVVEDFYSENAGDTAVEIDNAELGIVSRLHVVNAFNTSVYLFNARPPARPEHQLFVLRDIDTLQTVSPGIARAHGTESGAIVVSAPTPSTTIHGVVKDAIGHVLIERFRYRNTTPDPWMGGVITEGYLHRLTIADSSFEYSGISYDGASSRRQFIALDLHADTGAADSNGDGTLEAIPDDSLKMTLRNVAIRVGLARKGAGCPADIYGIRTGAPFLDYDVDGVVLDWIGEGLGLNDHVRSLALGWVPVGTVVPESRQSGTLRNIVIRSSGSPALQLPIAVMSRDMFIANPYVGIEGLDTEAAGPNGSDFSLHEETDDAVAWFSDAFRLGTANLLRTGEPTSGAGRSAVCSEAP